MSAEQETGLASEGEPESPPTGADQTEGEGAAPEALCCGSEGAETDRRGFLGLAGAGLAAGLGATAAAPLLAAVVTPLRGGVVSTLGDTVDAGPLANFTDKPTKVVVELVRQDAWTRTKPEAVGAVYVMRRGESVEAWSSICPHASCAVSWQAGDERYVCPCHQTYFKADGSVISGPSPRPLDTLPVEVRDGRVFVTWKQYRPGRPTKEEV